MTCTRQNRRKYQRWNTVGSGRATHHIVVYLDLLRKVVGYRLLHFCYKGIASSNEATGSGRRTADDADSGRVRAKATPHSDAIT